MSQPMEIFESQNVRDDDGAVIDSFFIETDAPPNLAEATEPILVHGSTPVAKYTRLFSGEQVIPIDWQPYQLLPADASRLGLLIRVYSPTAIATDGIRISDERGLATSAGKLLHGGSLNLDDHTGSVWVYPTGNASGLASAPVAVEFWSTSGPKPIDYSEVTA